MDIMRSTFPTMEKDHLKSYLSGMTNFYRSLSAKALVVNLKGTPFSKRLLIVDAKGTFNQAVLEIGIHNVDNFIKVLMEMFKHGIMFFY